MLQMGIRYRGKIYNKKKYCVCYKRWDLSRKPNEKL